MINSTLYEKMYWDTYKPNGTFYCINESSIILQGTKDSKIRKVNSSWV
jgi:hypothetical protein